MFTCEGRSCRSSVWITASVLLFAMAFLPLATWANTCSSQYAPRRGFNFMHAKVDISQAAQCITAKAATVSAADNIALNYDRPEIRVATSQILADMAKRGATAVRTILWYIPVDAPPDANAPSHDKIGTIRAVGGAAPPAFLNQLLAYAGDVDAAGYRDLYISFGPQWKALVGCRINTWGDCYDPRTLEASWHFISDVVSAFATRRMRVAVTYDLSNETCFSDQRGDDLNVHGIAAAEFLIKRFHATYPHERFTISCAALSPSLLKERVQTMIRLYQRLGVRPANVEIHAYFPSELATRDAIADGQQAAATLGVPLVIGEIPYDDPYLADIKLNDADLIFVWPKSTASSCAYDASPPYTGNFFGAMCP